MNATGTRLPQVEETSIDDLELRTILDRAAAVSAPAPAWYLTLAHSPEFAKAYDAYWELTHRGGRIEHTTKELMRITIAQLLGCDFCAAQRSVLAQEQGLQEEVALVCALPDYEHEDARVRAALKYARALVVERDAAAFDDVYVELRAVFDDAEVVELACFAAIAIGAVTVARSLQINP